MAEKSEPMIEKAEELGRLLGQTDEYQTLKRARDRISDDRETTELLNRLGTLERELTAALQSGQSPEREKREEYEELVSTLQSSSLYQSLVAAQSNFDKIVSRVNEAMGRGMESGAQSRIILSS
ncbi:MAG: YlbF family regulator [Gemmatimonadota bacterium]